MLKIRPAAFARMGVGRQAATAPEGRTLNSSVAAPPSRSLVIPATTATSRTAMTTRFRPESLPS